MLALPPSFPVVCMWLLGLVIDWLREFPLN